MKEKVYIRCGISEEEGSMVNHEIELGPDPSLCSGLSGGFLHTISGIKNESGQKL
jgi:hypothetical protein